MARTKKVRTPFEGIDVISTAVAITNAGDGLSKAMSIDNEEFHMGQTVHVVLECEVAAITHKRVKDTDGLTRIQTLKAGRATLVEADVVDELLDEQTRKLEEAAGITPLPGMDHTTGKPPKKARGKAKADDAEAGE